MADKATDRFSKSAPIENTKPAGGEISPSNIMQHALA